MHGACMATKTISLELDAYERLKNAKLHEKESFSMVVRRAVWPDTPMTGREILRFLRSRTSHLSDDDLAGIEAADQADLLPEDPWHGK